MKPCRQIQAANIPQSSRGDEDSGRIFISCGSSPAGEADQVLIEVNQVLVEVDQVLVEVDQVLERRIRC